MKLQDLFTREEPLFEMVSLVFLTQPEPSVLRQISQCAELRARLFGVTEVVKNGETQTKLEPHILVLDQHCVRMSDNVVTLNNTVRRLGLRIMTPLRDVYMSYVFHCRSTCGSCLISALKSLKTLQK